MSAGKNIQDSSSGISCLDFKLWSELLAIKLLRLESASSIAAGNYTHER